MSQLTELQAQFVIHHRVDGDPEDMLVTFGVDLAQVEPDPLAAAENCFEEYTASPLQYLSSAVSVSRVDVEIGGLAGSTITTYQTTAVAGARGASMLIQNTAYLVQKRTGGVGRGKNGRAYLPGVPDDKVNNVGVVSVLELDEIQAALDVFLTNMVAAGYDLVVNHQESSPLYPATLVTTLVIDPVCGSQRRRLRH